MESNSTKLDKIVPCFISTTLFMTLENFLLTFLKDQFKYGSGKLEEMKG